MLHQIEQWIDKTNLEFQEERISCSRFHEAFKGFYSLDFLENSYFVLVDKIPKPDFPELGKMGLGDFIDMKANGITYKNTYYILSHLEADLRLHFHELVHVAQWKHLGATPFMQRYMSEIQTFGYNESPLEEMAYSFDAHFTNNGSPRDIPSYVVANL